MAAGVEPARRIEELLEAAREGQRSAEIAEDVAPALGPRRRCFEHDRGAGVRGYAIDTAQGRSEALGVFATAPR